MKVLDEVMAIAVEVAECVWDSSYSLRCAAGHTWKVDALQLTQGSSRRDRVYALYAWPCPICNQKPPAEPDPDALRVDGGAE